MLQATYINRGPIAVALVALLLTAVTAGAFMLTCAEDVHAVEDSAHGSGTACDLHEGHSAPEIGPLAVPTRSDVSDIAVSSDAASFPPVSAHWVETTDPLDLPLQKADPLFGRLLI